MRVVATMLYHAYPAVTGLQLVQPNFFLTHSVDYISPVARFVQAVIQYSRLVLHVPNDFVPQPEANVPFERI